MVWRAVAILGGTVVAALIAATIVSAQTNTERLITVYDRGETSTFLTKADTLKQALAEHSVALYAHDTVEPGIDEKLIAREYNVNIYRSRPVVVVDGSLRLKRVSPYQTARQIAKDVGVTLYAEDATTLAPIQNSGDGIGLELTIKRANILTFDLYGRKTEFRSQAATLDDVLKEKKITLGDKDRVSLSLDTKVVNGLQVRIWREGKQTVSVDQAIAPSSEIVYDADRPLGYRAVENEGVAGVRSITYELEIKDGVEVSKIEIANIITKQPKAATEVIGLRNDGRGLTKSRGAQHFVDSKGVSHRETYYDLNMNVVMRACGQGGYYTVRPDGAKVDAQGYIIVAANYGNYPRCSIVETSLGPGKVYDTGGFAARHPFGFDLATDWTRGDGI